MCSESSPRLSFDGNDVDREDEDSMRVKQHESRRDLQSEPDGDFEFSICSSNLLDYESSLADEVFANGMILPVPIQERHVVTSKLRYDSPRPSLPPLPSSAPNSDDVKKPQKSLWGFKRSSSLNCDIKMSLICNLPLLSRSKSTGSAPNPNKRSNLKEMMNKQKQQSVSVAKPMSSGSSSSSSSMSQKPPLRKSFGGPHHGQGIRINPILNVPPNPGLFGLGSLLNGGKQKTNRK